MKPLYETIADIAYLAGQFGYYSGDSRADMNFFVSLAKEFEEKYKSIDWETSDLDYMTEVENFATLKLGLKPKLNLSYPNAFKQQWDNIEIERCRDDGEDTYPIHDSEDVEPNDFYSVYVHMVEGGLMCVADLPTEEAAIQLAETLKLAVKTYQDNGYLD